jgi:hypothetical protein
MTIFLKNLDLSQLRSKTKKKKLATAAAKLYKPKKSRTKALSFPVKLHRMLEAVENEGRQSIVSWNIDGTSFQVHNIERFVTEVLPKHFKQSKYKSFQRQLNFYGFKRVTSGPDEGCYGHPAFVGGNEELCRTIKRQQAQENQPFGNDDFTPLDADCGCYVDAQDAADLLCRIARNSFLKLSEGIPAPSSMLEHYVQANLQNNDKDDRVSFVGKNFFFLPSEFDDI